MKRLALAALLACACRVVMAQPTYAPGAFVPPVPSVSIDGSGHLILTYPGAAPIDAGLAQGATGPLNSMNVLSYQVATAGGAIAMTAGKAVLMITGGGVVAAQTVKLPPNPTDGQFVRIASQVAITALTIQDAAGNAVGTTVSVAALSAGGLYQFQSNAWVRIA